MLFLFHLLDSQLQLLLLVLPFLRELLLLAFSQLKNKGKRVFREMLRNEWLLHFYILKEDADRPCLDLVGEIFDLVHSSIVFVSQLSELLLSPLVHLLQVRTFIFCVTESPLNKE